MSNVVNFNKPTELEKLFNEVLQYRERVKHLTVFVTYDDNSMDVFHDEQKLSHLCLTEKILSAYVEDLLF